jgi:hypothetical protein
VSDLARPGFGSRIRAAIDIIFPGRTIGTPDSPQLVAEGTRPAARTKLRPRTAPVPVNRTRWLQADVESAALQAGNGDMSLAAQLYRSFQRDGMIQGLLGTRTGGLIRLPKAFTGTPEAVALLEGADGRVGLFQKYFPAAELQRLATDGLVLGVAVGEFVQRPGDEHPVLTRLDPEFLRYRPWEDRWYYQSLYGMLPIEPGDGRWFLHTPHGRYEPWNHGLWQALGRAYVSKEHALLYRENYAGKLANPARVAVSPQGASEGQKQSWWRAVMAWGVNSVFGVTPGYDVKLLESNGRGYEVFKDIIETAGLEIMVEIAGQVVTVTGGVGFANANIHATIRSDLIQGDGDNFAESLNSQVLPPVVADLVGLGHVARVSWDTRPPADLKVGAESLTASAKALTDLTAALQAHGLKLDVSAVASRFAIPVLGDVTGDGKPDEALAGDGEYGDPAPNNAEALAAKMTELGIPRCEHGYSNRCRICGIERVRDVVMGDDGEPKWSIAWQAITSTPPPPPQLTPAPKTNGATLS